MRLPREPFDPIRFTLLDHFDQLKRVNHELKTLGKTVLGLDSVNVYHTPNVPQGARRLGGEAFLDLGQVRTNQLPIDHQIPPLPLAVSHGLWPSIFFGSARLALTG